MLAGETPQRLAFEQQYYGGARQPQPQEHGYLQSLWHFELTSSGRDRACGRVVLEGLPDPGQDDGRPIPALVLDRFARVIAAYYTAPQLATFLYDSGLSDDRFGQPLDSEEGKVTYLNALLGLIESGTPELRRALRSLLGRLLSGGLDLVPSADEREELTEVLARAGWYVQDDTLVIGERRRAPLTPAARPTVVSSLEGLHPLIAGAAKDLWNDGHPREAIQRAATALLDAVRQQSGLHGDGQDLMARAFRVEAPMIVVADLRTENGQNVQRGSQFIAMGAVAAIRNPTSHTLANHDEEQAREQLAVFSFIARRLEDARGASADWRGRS